MVWRLAPAITLALLVGPIAVGLAGTAAPAFGWLPAVGGNALSLQPWRELAAWPGFATALRLTITVGFGATAASLLLAAGFCAVFADRPALARLERFLAPLLGSPHAAVALGFAFLIAPSGWIARLISPELTGWDRPPAGIVTLQDGFGLSFLAGLLLKETPYLVLMILAASNQIPVRATLASARSLGHSRGKAWLAAVFPQIYGQIRLPIYAVLAFSLSAVDVGIILAPGNPPPLAVQATRWFSDYDLARWFPAAAAALLQLAIALGGIVLWRFAEEAAARLGRRWIEAAAPGRLLEPLLKAAAWTAIGVGALGLLSIAGMVVWSLAAFWRFPDVLPGVWSFAMWATATDRAGSALLSTLAIGAASTCIALVLVVACLENERRRGFWPGRGVIWLIYTPLLVPQIAFLFGVQVALVRLGLDGTSLAVAWAHLVFVLPYVFLSLSDPFRALDPRYAASAAALGASPDRVLATVILPMLLRPILVAFAVGFAVSVGQYLATLFPGAGRVATLTTEAVTLAGGADRRVIGVYAVLQAALPLAVYGLALTAPRLVYWNRKGLS
jgi:putative thiamine transport system permease protein